MITVNKILEKYPRNCNNDYVIICYANNKQFIMSCNYLENITRISYLLRDAIRDCIVDGKHDYI